MSASRILRARDVCVRTGLSRTTIWRLTRSGDFPAPRRLSANAVGWLERDVELWIESRASANARCVLSDA